MLSPGPGRVKVDPGQIEQVIVNLAVNARDAMPEGGKVTIEVSNVVMEEKAYVTLAVRDTGSGMDSEAQAHLFEPFYSTKARGKGTGLGLSIVYGIIKQAGGNITVKSQLGQGAVFEIFLPRILNIDPPQESGKIVEKIALGSETILLVEDEEVVRKLVGQVLRASGYTVLEAGNGVEAIEGVAVPGDDAELQILTGSGQFLLTVQTPQEHFTPGRLAGYLVSTAHGHMQIQGGVDEVPGLESGLRGLLEVLDRGAAVVLDAKLACGVQAPAVDVLAAESL